MYCMKCGAQLSEGSAFCPRCGESLAPVADQPQLAGDISPKSRLATSLLAFLVGDFGVHRFYVGRTATAIVMLVLGAAPFICGSGAVAVAAASYSDLEARPLLFWLLFGLAVASAGAASIWSLVDFIIAVSGNFKDSRGKPIKKW